ncbi:MAG: polysaccharide deacetylase family protein [Acidimicrobiia bacterium]|nr:polysaccharide deacetylase family protein [Acidimicrobiia bacterium]
MGRASGALRRAVKEVAVAVDAVHRPPQGTVVLIYHRVGGRRPSEIDLPTAAFDEQVAAIAATGRAGTLDDSVEHLTGRAATGPSVVVTFDDGTADFVDEALPVLVRHGVPALLYVATDFVERGRAFPGDGTPVSWAGLREAVSTGLVALGSHTHTHALLDRIAAAEVDDELDRSIELLRTRAGANPRHFAYPKAVAGSPAADAAVRARFASAALSGSRSNVAGSTDPWRLARSPVQTSDGTRFFTRKLAGGMAFEETARQRLNRRRYAGATT